jgi:histone H3/H4
MRKLIKMSFLRDQQLVTGLAKNLDIKELTTEAARVVLNETELMIRTLLMETVKYTKKFKRDTIIVGDLDIVLDQMNLQLLSMGR